MRTLCGFILTRLWRDERDGLLFSYWMATDHGPAEVRLRRQQAVCFVPREDTTLQLSPGVERSPVALRDPTGGAVDALYFPRQRMLRQWCEQPLHRALAFEADIKPNDRFLMERFIHAEMRVTGDWVRDAARGHWVVETPLCRPEASDEMPSLRLLSLDIETHGSADGMIYSIAATGLGDDHVFLNTSQTMSPPQHFSLTLCPDEKTLLQRFFLWFQKIDPDVIIGWNVVGFDLLFMQQRCAHHGIAFDMARGREGATILKSQRVGQPHIARIPGRAVLDGIELLRAGFWQFERFSLEHVAHALLGKGKLVNESGSDKVAEIRRLYRQEPLALANYNHQDCVLVEEIFEHAKLLPFAVARSRMTGLALDKLGGSVAAFEHHYLPRLHRRGRVALSMAQVKNADNSPGGYVMDSQPGLYDNVLVLDFKSLYPSIIRTFLIDPLGLMEAGDDAVAGFLGAKFSRDNPILPSLIAELWARRDQAKQHKDAPLSQAIKIIMNSFYGVLGSSTCRFFDPRLASSITMRGHEIITRSRDFLEAEGFQVIYGDTDSLFVLLGPDVDGSQARNTGKRLAAALNQWWQSTLHREHRLDSYLEIEFETHYRRFLMPTLRGAEGGSKKRYAGVIREAQGQEQLIFKGLESVRTDWTPLARAFQRELYRRVFAEEPVEAFCRQTVAAMYRGAHDDELVLRKRLRKPLASYVKNIPPHVQAAKKMAKPDRWIEYVMSTHGPEPYGQSTSVLDYDWYLERQLTPVADSILQFVGLSLGGLCDRQQSLF